MAKIPSIVVARSWRRHLLSFRTEGAVAENIKLKEIAMETWTSLLVGEQRKREVVLKLFNLWWPQSSLEPCLSDTCGTSKRAERDVLLGMFGHNTLLNWNSAVSVSSLLWKREQINRA